MSSVLLSLALLGPGCAVEPTAVPENDFMGIEAQERTTVVDRLAILEHAIVVLNTRATALESANATLTAELATANADLAQANARIDELELRDAESRLVQDGLVAFDSRFMPILTTLEPYDALFATYPPLPAGVSFDNDTGAISGTPINPVDRSEFVVSTGQLHDEIALASDEWEKRYSELTTAQDAIEYAAHAGLGERIDDVTADVDVLQGQLEATDDRLGVIEVSESSNSAEYAIQYETLQKDNADLEVAITALDLDLSALDGRVDDIEEWLGIGASTCPDNDPDLDDDGLCNSDDSDDDGDGFYDCIDNDMDGDGLYPADDLDDDGDGIPDANDPTPFGSTCA